MAKTRISQGNIKRILLLILLLGIVFFGSFIGDNATEKNVLKTNYEIETPNIKDKKLADFYLWTKEDPLLTSPNFDNKSFLISVKALRDEEDAYLKLIKRKDKIFPTDFLISMAEVGKTHDEFIKNPNQENAKKLIEAYKKTAKFYKTDIESLIKIVEAINLEKFDRANIILLNTVVDNDIVIYDLHKLRENAYSLEKEIDSRQKCLEKGIECKRPASEFSNLRTSNQRYSFSEKDLLPKEIINPIPGFLEIGQWSGPYAVTTGCLGLSNELKEVPHLYYLISAIKNRDYQKPHKDLIELYAKLATTNYYDGLDENGFEVQNNFSKAVNKRIMMESNVYDCFSSEHKITLASIDYLYKNYKDKQVFSGLLKNQDLGDEQRQFFENGRRFEKSFFESEFPSDISANNLANYYALFYKKIIEWKSDSSLNENSLVNKLFSERDSYLRRYLEFKRGFGDIDKILNNARNNFSSFRVKYLISSVDFKSDYIDYVTYILRSMYGLLYIPFSSSVYRLDNSLLYFPKTKIESVFGYDKRYMTYHEALKYYSMKEVESWIHDTSLDLEKKFNNYLMTHPDIKN